MAKGAKRAFGKKSREKTTRVGGQLKKRGKKKPKRGLRMTTVEGDKKGGTRVDFLRRWAYKKKTMTMGWSQEETLMGLNGERKKQGSGIEYQHKE